MQGFRGLKTSLEQVFGNAGLKKLAIQTHDFPDHDALASAWALSRLLSRIGYRVPVIYRGKIQSHALMAMVKELDIQLFEVQIDKEDQWQDWQIILVDGSPNKSNAQPIGREVFGVIDHHPQPGNLDCPWVEIRSSYGSCSSIVADLWQEAGIELDQKTATALLMGIQMDTDFLSRGVSPMDLAAFHRIFFIADWQFGTRTLKTSLAIDDLDKIEMAISRCKLRPPLLFTEIPVNCRPELISVLADFFLRLKEVLVSVIIEAGGDQYRISIRSRDEKFCANDLIGYMVQGVGKGGGHEHMAGGAILPHHYPRADYLYKRCLTYVEEQEGKH